MTKDIIIKKLKEVIDPELNINIVDLGLVYEVKINKDEVLVVMTLTTPGCPLAYMFEEEVTKAVKKVKGVKKVRIDLTFEPMWTPEKMTKEARRKIGY